MTQLDTLWQPRRPRAINQHHQTLFQLFPVHDPHPRQTVFPVDQIPTLLCLSIIITSPYNSQAPLSLLTHEQYPSPTAFPPSSLLGSSNGRFQRSLACNQYLASGTLYLSGQLTHGATSRCGREDAPGTNDAVRQHRQQVMSRGNHRDYIFARAMGADAKVFAQRG
ncbi:putative acyl-coenzyme A synthetase [Alternaria alternata]|nr:putative acyl-coenzyme A synthetase [Alternaria alternata]